MKVKDITIEINKDEFRDKLDIRDGIDGKDGKDGKDGIKGEKGDKPDHKWVGTKLSFENPDGTWGKEVDLRGKDGKNGSVYSLVGSGGKSKLVDLTDVNGTPNITGQIPVWNNTGKYFDFDKNINDIELALTTTSGNSYMEYTTVGDNITQVNYWTDSGKGTKLFTKDITYSGSNPTQVVVTDEISNRILTTTIAYSGNTVTNITKIIT